MKCITHSVTVMLKCDDLTQHVTKLFHSSARRSSNGSMLLRRKSSYSSEARLSLLELESLEARRLKDDLVGLYCMSIKLCLILSILIFINVSV